MMAVKFWSCPQFEHLPKRSLNKKTPETGFLCHLSRCLFWRVSGLYPLLLPTRMYNHESSIQLGSPKAAGSTPLITCADEETPLVWSQRIRDRHDDGQKYGLSLEKVLDYTSCFVSCASSIPAILLAVG